MPITTPYLSSSSSSLSFSPVAATAATKKRRRQSCAATTTSEDSVTADWRIEAENVIRTAVKTVSRSTIATKDITWHSSKIIVTLGQREEDDEHDDPAEVELLGAEDFQQEGDENDDELEDEEEEEEDDDDDYEEELDEKDDEAMEDGQDDFMDDEDDNIWTMNNGGSGIDSNRLQRLTHAILSSLEALQEDSEEVMLSSLLERHEVILTTPGIGDALQTQREFNAFRGFEVMVELLQQDDDHHGKATATQKKKNKKKSRQKVLTGRLVDRTAKSVTINIKGRMKTIPNEQIATVKLPPAKFEKGVPRGPF